MLRLFGWGWPLLLQSDDTSVVLAELAAADSRARAIHLSRNFGHQAALSAGLDACACDADAVIMMDGDAGHPPTLIAKMPGLSDSGYDIAQTQSADRGHEGFFLKNLSSRGFYRAINRLGETQIVRGSADFRLMSREAVNALRQLPEYHSFFRGMVQWIGFSTVILLYVPEERIAGKSKYSVRRMLRLAGDRRVGRNKHPSRTVRQGRGRLAEVGGDPRLVPKRRVRTLRQAQGRLWSTMLVGTTRLVNSLRVHGAQSRNPCSAGRYLQLFVSDAWNHSI